MGPGNEAGWGPGMEAGWGLGMRLVLQLETRFLFCVAPNEIRVTGPSPFPH